MSLDLQQMHEEERIRQTGEWWVDPWWLKDNWLEIRPLSSTEVETAIEYLKVIFTPDWLRKYEGELIENVFLRSVIYDQSAFTRHYLVALAERLKRLEGTRGFSAVLDNLRGRQESDAADMELQLAYYFAQEGYQVDFPIAKSKKGKTPDIRLTKGLSNLAVECKRLRLGEDAAWLSSVLSHVSSQLMNLAEVNELWFEFSFSDKVLHRILESRKGGECAEDVAITIVKRISDEIKTAVTRAQWPLWLLVSNCGEGFFYKAKSKDSKINIPGLPDSLVFRRMLKNAISRATEQLRNENSPGLIAVHARDIPSEDCLVRYLNRFLFSAQESAHVLAILILPWQGWFHHNRPHLIVNRNSLYRWDDSGVAAVLAKFDPVLL